VFVTGGAMQPSLTIVALALRLADHLADRLRTAERR
jgi:choline dehydrogenase-like flavoprotein